MKKIMTLTGLVLALFLIGNTYAYMGMGGYGGGGPMMGNGYQYQRDNGNIIDRFLGRLGWGGGYGPQGGYGMGPGMMGGYGMMGTGGCGSWGYGYTSTNDEPITIEDATDRIEAYIEGTGLEIKEVMDFQYNYYAQIVEPDTGIGAFEVLVDKNTGYVSPEPGPNMMWNTKYGHMAWGAPTENTVTNEEAVDLAQAWLDRAAPGWTAEDHADEFYGYYTLHTMKDGEITGMLSVNGFTGAVWYHSWHGDFLAEVEEDV